MAAAAASPLGTNCAPPAPLRPQPAPLQQRPFPPAQPTPRQQSGSCGSRLPPRLPAVRAPTARRPA
eukprot:5169139-Lingulodinium_polyedra.AAC.1